MEKVQATLMHIISCFMHDTDFQLSNQLTKENWQELYELSKIHSLLPVTYETIKTNESFLKTDKAFKQKWQDESTSLVVKQIQLSNAFLNIYQKIKNNNIDCIVTKGIVLRELYSKKEWRVSGDEDIIIKKEDFNKVCQILLDNHYQVVNEVISDNVQVTTFIDPVSTLTIELHLQLFGNDTYLGFLNKYFENIFVNSKYIEIDGVSIQVMNEFDQLFYLICHCFKHFINNGVGLRQLMDIGMYSIKNYEFVDWDKLFNYANEFNISTFIHCVYSVLEDFYNVKMRDINYPKHLIDKLDYTDFLDDIFDSGVFGLSTKERVYSNLMTRRVLNEQNKKTSLISLIFPSAKNLRAGYPILYDKPYLLPYVWIKRMKGFINRYKCSKKETDLDMKKAIELGNKRISLLKKYKIIK